MSTRVVTSHPACVYPGCNEVGGHAFASHPDDVRCSRHFEQELARRIEAVNAGASVMKALIG